MSKIKIKQLDGVTYKMPLNNCPGCGMLKNRVTNIEDDSLPNEGDLDICKQCGCIGVYDKALNVIALTETELKVIGKEFKESDFSSYSKLVDIIKQYYNTPLNRNFYEQI